MNYVFFGLDETFSKTILSKVDSLLEGISFEDLQVKNGAIGWKVIIDKDKLVGQRICIDYWILTSGIGAYHLILFFMYHIFMMANPEFYYLLDIYANSYLIKDCSKLVD